jgi:1,2-diacylglycerol 3-alpha-glucosyltransferase
MGTQTAFLTAAIIHNHPIHYKHLLFTALAKEGLDFEVLFTGASSGNRIERPLPSNGEYRYRFGWEGPYEEASAIHTVRFVWQSLSELQPRVVIISGYYDIAAWTAWCWALRTNSYRVLWAESNEFDWPRWAWKERIKEFFIARCDVAHVYGQTNKEYVHKLGMPEDRIYIKRAVADTDRFLREHVPVTPKPPHKVLLYVGRFSEEKNLVGLLRAFRGVKQDPGNPTMVLDLVGYGPQENELRGLAKALGISSVVQFRGKFPQAELPAVYGGADAFVLPSLREPWGLVVNEAMLCGLPVLVSTQCGCAADLVRPETGWTFSPWDEQNLTGLLQRIAEMPRESLKEMGRHGRQISAEYSPENCAATVAESVRRLAQQNTQAA